MYGYSTKEKPYQGNERAMGNRVEVMAMLMARLMLNPLLDFLQ